MGGGGGVGWECELG